jgi:hypothetical protein
MTDQERVLALDVELYDERSVDSDFASTQTLLEHEIVIWNPERLLEPYDLREPYLGSPSLTDTGSAEFQRDSARRSREFSEFLSLGRLLAIFIPEPKPFWVATGETQNDGTKAKPRLKRLVDPCQIGEVLPGEPVLHPASGKRFEVVGAPAFAAFWRAVKDQFEYRAFIEAKGVQPMLKVKGTDRVVGATATFGDGQVLFLPHLLVEEPDCEQEDDEPDEAYWARWNEENEALQRRNDGVLLDALLEYARTTQGSSSEPLPAWTERLILPGEAAAAGKAAKAADAAERALRKREEARIDLVQVQLQKRLVVLDGKPLEQAAASALEALGCKVEAGRPHRTDRIVAWEGQTAVLEIKGTIKSASEAHATQLEKWVAEYALETGAPVKGILLVNAWRALPLADRTSPVFPDQMLAYSEGRGHCLLSTAQLLTALVVATSNAKKKAFLRLLFGSTGILEGYDWHDSLLPSADDQEDSAAAES